MIKKITALLLVCAITLGVSTTVFSQGLFPGIVANELENALLEAFDTTSPVEIGEYDYINFVNNFVYQRNVEAENFHAISGIYFPNPWLYANRPSAPLAMNCPFCGNWSVRLVTTYGGAWSFTGQVRAVGEFPYLNMEHKQSRVVVDEMIGSCGTLVYRLVTTAIRWV